MTLNLHDLFPRPCKRPRQAADRLQERLKWLKDSLGLTWAEIASQPFLDSFPQGTLHSIYISGHVPQKYRPLLAQVPLLDRPVREMNDKEILLALHYREDMPPIDPSLPWQAFFDKSP